MSDKKNRDLTAIIQQLEYCREVMQHTARKMERAGRKVAIQRLIDRAEELAGAAEIAEEWINGIKEEME